MNKVVQLSPSGPGGQLASSLSSGIDADRFRYFQIERHGDVALVIFDAPDASMNTLNERVLDELEWAIDLVEAQDAIKAVVLTSGKRDCFVAGADIEILRRVDSRAMGEEVSRRGQRAFARWADCNKLTVAAIRGACLGGGMELALACDKRIAADHPKTVLGLPEVKLGLFPAGGGTQRLPPLVGLRAALDLMLTGKNVYPRRAKRIGLVDEVVDPWGLEHTAIRAARSWLSKKSDGSSSPRGSVAERTLEGSRAGQRVIFSQVRKMVEKTTRGNYPAPHAVIDCVRKGIEEGPAAGYALEIECFGRLTQSEAARSLIGLFTAEQTLKKAAKNLERGDRPEVDSVCVLGAGLMGAGIALTSARKGMRVLLRDIDDAGVARGLRQIDEELARLKRKRILSPFEYDEHHARIAAQTDLNGVAGHPIIIEAVFEDIALKHRVLQEAEALVGDDCVLATNTSALPIASIAEGCRHPENVVGMHYFSPVHKMPLLEVVQADGTSQRAVDVAVEVGHRQGKTVIVVKDRPGFYTTRILAPYLDEAVLLSAGGADLHELDRIMVDLGYPVGPMTLFDEVGIDTISKIGVDLKREFGARLMAAEPQILQDMVAAGRCGRKSGAGFFDYQKQTSGRDPISRVVNALGGRTRRRRPIDGDTAAILERHAHTVKSRGLASDSREIGERMLLRMVNEAVRCLEEGIINSPGDGDLGAVFGLGFPPFLGGPFRYVDCVGAKHVVGRLDGLSSKFGERFKPAQRLVDMAVKGGSFHEPIAAANSPDVVASDAKGA